MVNHCANPACRKSLHYLREGKVFLFSRKDPQGSSKLPDRMEHFWLCGSCAKEWTLTSDTRDGIKLVQMRNKRLRAGYAVASAAPAS